MVSKLVSKLILVSILPIVLIGCSSTSDNTSTSSNQTSLSGTVEIDGSSTVFPISEAVAEEFYQENPSVRVNVAVSGTGGGFKRFANGETHINDASREMKETERIVANQNGVEFVELRIGTDGLSVLVDPANNYVDCLTTNELKQIWEPGTTIEYWSDLRAEFPRQKLHRFGPDTDSGTFDFFTDKINGEAQASTDQYQASADDNVLVRGISGTKGAIGYFGYAYYQENKESLKTIGIDNGNGCIIPTNITIADGSYSPLSRPLFIYVNVESLNEPQVKAFVDFYLIHGAALANEVGYVAASDEVYDNNKRLVD
ncbi:MAG: PstS family phosphate ABC transporter substrate-binding protein [Dehalococcoidia bacterium]